MDTIADSRRRALFRPASRAFYREILGERVIAVTVRCEVNHGSQQGSVRMMAIGNKALRSSRLLEKHLVAAILIVVCVLDAVVIWLLFWK